MKIRGNTVGTNMSIDKIAERIGGGGGSGGESNVFVVSYDLISCVLDKPYEDVLAAFRAGKNVVLTGTSPLGSVFCYFGAGYFSNEESEGLGEHIEFSSVIDNQTQLLIVTPDGTCTTKIVNFGDIDSALDRIIAIQNSLIGGV